MLCTREGEVGKECLQNKKELCNRNSKFQESSMPSKVINNFFHSVVRR